MRMPSLSMSPARRFARLPARKRQDHPDCRATAIRLDVERAAELTGALPHAGYPDPWDEGGHGAILARFQPHSFAGVGDFQCDPRWIAVEANPGGCAAGEAEEFSS